MLICQTRFDRKWPQASIRSCSGRADGHDCVGIGAEFTGIEKTRIQTNELIAAEVVALEKEAAEYGLKGDNIQVRVWCRVLWIHS